MRTQWFYERGRAGHFWSRSLTVQAFTTYLPCAIWTVPPFTLSPLFSSTLLYPYNRSRASPLPSELSQTSPYAGVLDCLRGSRSLFLNLHKIIYRLLTSVTLWPSWWHLLHVPPKMVTVGGQGCVLLIVLLMGRWQGHRYSGTYSSGDF